MFPTWIVCPVWTMLLILFRTVNSVFYVQCFTGALSHFLPVFLKVRLTTYRIYLSNTEPVLASSTPCFTASDPSAARASVRNICACRRRNKYRRVAMATNPSTRELLIISVDVPLFTKWLNRKRKKLKTSSGFEHLHSRADPKLTTLLN